MYDQIKLQVQKKKKKNFKSLYNTSTYIQVWVWRWRGIKPNEHEGKDQVNKEFYKSFTLQCSVKIHS